MGRIEIINSARRNKNKGAGQLPTTRQPPRGRKHITQTYVILVDRKSAVSSTNEKILAHERLCDSQSTVSNDNHSHLISQETPQAYLWLHSR